MVRTPENRRKRTQNKEYEEVKKILNKKQQKIKQNETKASMHSGRWPSPEGTRLLFAGTISPMSNWWTNVRTTQK